MRTDRPLTRILRALAALAVLTVAMLVAARVFGGPVVSGILALAAAVGLLVFALTSS